jgi:hypothetical protein
MYQGSHHRNAGVSSNLFDIAHQRRPTTYRENDLRHNFLEQSLPDRVAFQIFSRVIIAQGSARGVANHPAHLDALEIGIAP